jgi:hypothetical protein
MIIGVMFSAFFLVNLWRLHKVLKIVAVMLFLSLTLSGVIDFFPILNDYKISLNDYGKNKDVAWIIKNTNPKSIFLNTQYLYDNASIAGRKVFLGWPYFAWSQGYDTLKRDDLRKSLLNTNDLKYFCKNVNTHNLSYAEILSSDKDTPINTTFFINNFPKVFFNRESNFSIFQINNVCKNI